jgi:ribosomal protein L16 Arg81 hydroxylase
VTPAQNPAPLAPTHHDDVLAPGDMLYLPPHIAHDGVAVDVCTTY